MATPTANYTTPAFVSVALPAPIKPVPFVLPPTASYACSAPRPPAYELVNTTLQAIAPAPILPFLAPPPPMGRLVATTLPSVYRESDNGPRRPRRGQLWPRTR